MSGPFAFGPANPADGAALGRQTGWRLSLHGTVTIDDVAAFVADPLHRGRLSGEVELPGRANRIPFRDGVFNLFAPGGEPDLTLLVYEVPLRLASNGADHDQVHDQVHYLAGRKSVRDDLGLDLWPDTTTLDVRLHQGRDATGPIVGSGVLRLTVAELLRLLASARTLHAGSPLQSATAVARFGRLFLENLAASYLLRPRAYARARRHA
jgi:cholesterol oxidase